MSLLPATHIPELLTDKTILRSILGSYSTGNTAVKYTVKFGVSDPQSLFENPDPALYTFRMGIQLRIHIQSLFHLALCFH
jgi:hypothetical protein